VATQLKKMVGSFYFEYESLIAAKVPLLKKILVESLFKLSA
jgi:hypothetical protein